MTRSKILLLAGLWLATVAAPAAPKNILLIIADDYGAGNSRLYNSTNTGAVLPPTPNIESLVTNGVVFRHAYANPVCSPTRACILTGQYGFRSGIGFVVNPGIQLSTNAFTLPMAFSNALPGHAVAQFGKWHLANANDSPGTVGRWPHFAGAIHGLVNYTNWAKVTDGVEVAGYTNYPTTDVVNDATTWIQTNGASAWFAWVAFNAPHAPLHLPPTNLCPTYANLPAEQTNINANPTPYYNAMVEAMDTEIGRLLSVVDRANTHIIFLGDNGTPDKPANEDTLQPPYPDGRGKGEVYEGGIRVPFIVSGPSVANPNRTNDTLVHAVDLFSTMVELAGGTIAAAVPPDVVIDSRSFLGAVTNDAVLPRFMYSEIFQALPGSGDRCLRDERYKLITFTNDASQAFYDLQTDPYEGTNLVDTLTVEQRQYYERLRFLLYGYTTNSRPVITSAAWTDGQFVCTFTKPPFVPIPDHELWRCQDLGPQFWSRVTNVASTATGAGTKVTVKDPTPPSGHAFYSIVK